jgi:hypothetical protein
MHRRYDFFRSWPLWALILASAAPIAHAAQPLPSLYGSIVADSNTQQAAQQAMREVLVRLTGERDADSDPALAGLISDARRYVQLERSTTTGTTQVLFDGNALRDAIVAAGRSVWDPDRPLVWVLLPRQEPAAADSVRARLTAAAQERGLPITIAAGAAADGVGGDAEAQLAAARRVGAGAVLSAQVSPSDAAALRWTMVAPTTGGHWAGAPELAIDAVTDALVQASRELGMAPVADFNCHISGVADLPSFAAVLSALRAAPEVTEVAVREAEADSLLLHLKARGNQAQLEHALASDRLRASAAGGHGALEYRYQSGP